MRFYQWLQTIICILGKTLTESARICASHLVFSKCDADIAVDHDFPNGQRRIVNILKDFPGGLSAGPLKN